MHSYFPLSNTKDVNPAGTGAGHGLKRLKQTHSSSFGGVRHDFLFLLDYFFRLFFFFFFITLTYSPGASALRNDFLPVEDEEGF